jgi:hypothetical protein
MHTVERADEQGPDSQHRPAVLDLLYDIPLAGDGAPLVREDAVAEFAATTGMNDATARQWIGDTLELAYRLPRLFDRLFEETLPVWKARQVATATRPLSAEGAAWIDAQVAHRFEKGRLHPADQVDHLCVDAVRSRRSSTPG